MSREVCDHGRIFHGPCPACDALAPEPTYTAADIETIIQRGLELAKEQRNIDLAAAVETAVTAAVLDHGQAWQDIADHLGGLCLGGVDVRANQQQICAEIDARVAAAYKRGMMRACEIITETDNTATSRRHLIRTIKRETGEFFWKECPARLRGGCMTEEQRLRELAKKRFDLIQEQKQRIRELEEENEIYLNCLHGSSKATYTAEMWDKREKETKAKLSRYAELVAAVRDWRKDEFYGRYVLIDALAALDAEKGE